MNHSNWNSCIDFERNEIVFENRNKHFGAYVIRRDYQQNLLLAFFTACLLMSTVFIPLLLKPFQSPPNVILEKFSEAVNLEVFTPPPVEPVQPPITQQTSPSQISKELINPIVVDNRIAITDVQMASGNPSTTGLLPNDGENNSTIAPGVSALAIPDIIPEKAVTKWAEIMPKFKGGDEKHMTYLASHIRYRSKALSNNIEGTVYVSFVVDTSGLITNVQLIHGISDDCDLEAIKAVRNMPKWIPGSQNGNKVNVEMSLPVRFIIK